MFVHFLPRGRKRNQKKTPVSRLILRVSASAGACGNSPTLRRAQTVRTLFPVRPADARRGTKGYLAGIALTDQNQHGDLQQAVDCVPWQGTSGFQTGGIVRYFED
jgi:hypothetical protein